MQHAHRHDRVPHNDLFGRACSQRPATLIVGPSERAPLRPEPQQDRLEAELEGHQQAAGNLPDRPPRAQARRSPLLVVKAGEQVRRQQPVALRALEHVIHVHVETHLISRTD